MIAKDINGCTPVEFARYWHYKEALINFLESFTNHVLATSAAHDSAAAVALNPKLDDFQRAIATDCLDLIRPCIEVVPDDALYMVLGHLSPLDVIKRSGENLIFRIAL